MHAVGLNGITANYLMKQLYFVFLDATSSLHPALVSTIKKLQTGYISGTRFFSLIPFLQATFSLRNCLPVSEIVFMLYDVLTECYRHPGKIKRF